MRWLKLLHFNEFIPILVMFSALQYKMPSLLLSNIYHLTTTLNGYIKINIVYRYTCKEDLIAKYCRVADFYYERKQFDAVLLKSSHLS